MAKARSVSLLRSPLACLTLSSQSELCSHILAEYLTRAWCLFELDTAIRSRIAIDVILTAEQHHDFVQTMASDGYNCIDAALANLKSETASASRSEDLNAIRALILSKPGGFATLNSTVQEHLNDWFVNQGAVRSSNRINRTRYDLATIPQHQDYIQVMGEGSNQDSAKINEEVFGFIE